MSGTLAWSDALWLARHRTPNDRLRFWGSAVSSGLAAAVVCSALGLIALGGGDVNSALGVVAEPGTRAGVVIAVFLVALPAVYLTAQTWKLGSVEQRERLLQLRDAGAGGRELRRVAVADALVPVGSGAAVGVAVLGLVIALLNLRRAWLPLYRVDGDTLTPTGAKGYVARMELLPNVAVVSWWPALVAIVAVCALAALAAALSVSRVDRQARRRRTLVGATAALTARRVSRPDLLLALRRIAQEPRATTRPAMLLGLAAFIAAMSTWLSRLFLASNNGFLEFYRQSFDLVAMATWLGVALCALGLVVTLTDAVLRRRRADAAAVAVGTPLGVLRRALVLQALLPAVLPVLGGLALGGLAGVVLTGGQMATGEDVGSGPFVPLPWLAWASWGVGILVVAGGAALIASTALGRTTQVDQLRVTA
jgi:hypothetical protein